MQVVEVDAAPEDAELAADALWQAGASAVSEEPAPGGRVRLRADVEAADRVDPRWRVAVIEPDTDAHLDAWRAFARPVVVGPVRLQPAWVPHEPVEGEVVVQLDPGRAFGSGSHASTRLALDALVRWLSPGAAVLDVGCGSGVLSVAAALLGAGSVHAVDVDAEAVRATSSNGARNDVSVTVSSGSAVDVDGTFDLVVANIGAAVLIEHAEAVVARVSPAGHLVLAGLLVDQADAVAAAYPGAVEVERAVDEGWAALVLRA
jgi:ribosomal protein L11 methyltransferase